MPYRLPLIRFQRMVRQIIRSSGTPHEIAFGVAIGIFVGLTPTVGLQMVIAAALAHLCRANRVVAVMPVWLTNPVTIVPVYLFNYSIGRYLIGGPGMTEVRHSLESIGTEGLSQLLKVGWEMQLPLWLGCCIIGIIAALPGYLVVYRAVQILRMRAVHRREAREERIRARLEEDEAALVLTPKDKPADPQASEPAESNSQV